MTESTDRFDLPCLAAAQAQKEVTHNEALALIDILLFPTVESVAPSTVPSTPQLGACWIVGSNPSAAWLGQSGAIAGWTASGWRFASPVEGMRVWSLADSRFVQRVGGAWTLVPQMVIIEGNQVVGARQGAIPNPNGGANIDAEARSAITLILARLRGHGLIAT
jgi:Protein of unknown function (DUF2793)